jgi:hypothetical protein
MKRLLVLLFASTSIGLAMADNPSTNTPVTISEAGVGPLNGNTPFNRKEVQKLLPSLKVKTNTSMTEGEEFPILEVSDKQGLLLTINPDGDAKRIYSIVAKSDRVVNSLGHKIGQTYKAVYGGRAAECEAGMEEQSGTVFCIAPNSKHVSYQFGSEHDGVDGEVPPLKFLNKWKIRAVIWHP